MIKGKKNQYARTSTKELARVEQTSSGGSS
jgi:hypothetical protein